jgi:hypothetical protein
MADVRMADARWACLTVERLKEERIPIDPILKKTGLTRRQVSNPDAQIPYHKHAALLMLAACALRPLRSREAPSWRNSSLRELHRRW